MRGDIQFILEVPGAGQFPVTSRQISRIGESWVHDIAVQWRRVGDELVRELETAYAAHERERSDKGETLSHKLRPAMTYTVKLDPGMGGVPSPALGVLDLNAAAEATSDTMKGEPEGGWFILYEDGHEGDLHGSEIYGWLPIGQAHNLAAYAIASLGLDSERAQSLREYVDKYMAGRHGDGIMTPLNRPLFKGYPRFGTAAQNGVQPHLGFTAWNIYRKLAPRMAGVGGMGKGDDKVVDAIQAAMRSTIQKMASGDLR